MLKMHSHLFRHPLPVNEEGEGVSQTIGHLIF
jgi:hypothetical protein